MQRVPFRVLVLGAYGFFGQRLFARLAVQSAYELVAAGRSRASAERLVRGCANPVARLSAAAIDIDAPDFSSRLAALAPHVVVHAAGPFQAQDWRVARACIACGAHYIDLADARAFVAGIGCLDADARHAGVVVLSGASSVPALSSAAADHLAEGLARVDRIDIGISPGNRTDRGLATVRAILGYCGQPIRSRQPAAATGWSGSRAYRYPAPVGARLLSPCDVPDLDVLAGRYAGEPLVRFGAGLELRLLHRAMNLMAWCAMRGLPRDWSAHAGWLKRLSDGFRHFGSDAGAMHVAVLGEDASGRTVERRWELVAERGDGPYVPTLAAAALVRQLALGRLPAGARPAVGVVDLRSILDEAPGLAIRTLEPAPRTPGMYAALLGPAYARLHPAVRAFHAMQGRAVLRGEVTTEPPRGRLARLLARLLGTPLRSSHGAIRFTLEAEADGEFWIREFPGRTMRSRLLPVDGQLEERLGPARVRFILAEVDGGLEMRLHSMRFLGIACPRWALPRVVARESGDDRRLCFEIGAELPLLGRVAGYRGWLDLARMERT